MRNLLALLFHRLAAPEKAERARAPKQADDFAKVLQASLGDANRDERSSLASASPTLALPEAEDQRRSVPDAQEGQTDSLLASPQTAAVRSGHGRSEAQVGPHAPGLERTEQDHVVPADSKATRLQHIQRGTTANPSRQTTDGDPAEAQVESPRALAMSPAKRDAATAGQSSEPASLSDARATTNPPADPPVRAPATHPATLDCVRPDPHTPATTPQPSEPAAPIEFSGEKNMPPNTSVVVDTLASPGTPSSRPGDRVCPQAWRMASEGHAERPIQGTPSQATDGKLAPPTHDPATAGPVDRDAAPAQPEVPPAHNQSALPQPPATAHPPVAALLVRGGELVDSGSAPVFAPPVSASPKGQAPSSEPRPKPSFPTAMPAMKAVEGNPPLLAQANRHAVSADQDPSAGEDAGLTRPNADASAVLEVPTPGLPLLSSRPGPETPRIRGEQQVPTPSSIAVEPKADGPRPMPPQSPPSIPHAGFGPQVATFVRPSGFAAVLPRPNDNGMAQVQIAPLTESTMPVDEAWPVAPRPIPRSPQSPKAAVTDTGLAPRTMPASPVAPDFLPVPAAKPGAPEITFITQAAIEIPQPSHTTAGSPPVASRRLPAEATPVGTLAHRLASKPHLETQVAPATPRPAREGTRPALPTTPSLVEGPKPSVPTPSTPLPAAQARPSTPVPTTTLPAAQTQPSRPAPSTPLPAAQPSRPASSTTLPAAQAQPSRPASSTTLPAAQPSTPALPTTLSAEETNSGETPRPGMGSLDVAPLAKPATPSLPPSKLDDGQGESGATVVLEPVQEEPTATLLAQPVAQPGMSKSKIQTAELAQPAEPVQVAQTSLQDIVPSPRTEPADTRPALPSHATLPSHRPVMADGLPAPAPVAPIRQSPAPVLPSGEVQLAAHPRGLAMPEPSAARKLDRGEQVGPVAQRPATEPTPFSAQTEASTASAPSLPVVESAPSSGTAPSDASPPQPKTEHAPHLTGRHGPRPPHPESHHARPESAAQPVATSAPSSPPQVETQPAPMATAEDGDTDPDSVSAASAPTSPASDVPQPLSSPSQPVVPPQVVAALTPSDKPMPRPDAPAAAAPVAPVTAGQTVLSVSMAPALPRPVRAADAPDQRDPLVAKDDARFSPAEPAPVARPHQARPLAAAAPRANTSDDNQNSAGNQNPSSHPFTPPAPVLPTGNDRPVDLPAPQVQASPSASDPAVVSPAQVSPPVVHAPPVDVRPLHLPQHMVPLAAQAVRDDGLNMTVMPHAAHLSIESNDGDLALHLRVHDGRADVTMGGSMAPLFEARAPEARAALASEGLNLGRFDLGQQGGGSGGQQGQPAPEHHERVPEPSAPYRHQPNHHEPAPSDGRIHVTA